MWGVDSKARWIRWVFRLPTLKSQPGANSLDFSLPSAGYVRMHVCTYVCVSLCVKITRPQSPRDFATATPWLKCGSRTLSCRQKGASEL